MAAAIKNMRYSSTRTPSARIRSSPSAPFSTLSIGHRFNMSRKAVFSPASATPRPAAVMSEQMLPLTSDEIVTFGGLSEPGVSSDDKRSSADCELRVGDDSSEEAARSAVGAARSAEATRPPGTGRSQSAQGAGSSQSGLSGRTAPVSASELARMARPRTPSATRML
jgi:hypothetical protein